MANKKWTPICVVKDWMGNPLDLMIFEDDGVVAIGTAPNGKNPFVTDIMTVDKTEFDSMIMRLAKSLLPPPNEP